MLMGVPRSGTTWIGKSLSLAPDVSYIFEPDAPRYPSNWAWRVYDYWDWREWYVAEDESRVKLSAAANRVVKHFRHVIESNRNGARTVIIKVPRVEKMPYILHRLQPDKVVFVRRNPLGVLNSHIKLGALENHGGHICREFEWLAKYDRKRELGLDYNSAVSTEDKLLILTKARQKIAPKVTAPYDSAIYRYESICADPVENFADLYRFLDLEWSVEIGDKIAGYCNPDREGSGMHTYKRKSIQRAHAWREELPLPLQKRAEELLQ